MSMFLGFQLTEINDPVRVRYWVYDLFQKCNRSRFRKVEELTTDQSNAFRVNGYN